MMVINSSSPDHMHAHISLHITTHGHHSFTKSREDWDGQHIFQRSDIPLMKYPGIENNGEKEGEQKDQKQTRLTLKS